MSTKIPLTRDRILAAAVAFADEHGVEALTMRKLAEELDAGAMSLYNHVASKDDLLVGMVDVVAGEIDLSPADGDWQATIRRISVSAHQALLRHRWAASLWSDTWPGPARLRYMDRVLEVLAGAGLPDALAHQAFHAVTMHVVGYTMQELSYQFEEGDLDELAAQFLAELDATEYPHMAAHVQAHIDDEGDDDEFGFVLDLILEGLQRRSG